jgi:hypothetical protein
MLLAPEFMEVLPETVYSPEIGDNKAPFAG